ncbi:hypothetical protein [Shewanella woodyi]|uniref:hypothetical protein n=1 Tax=Shewanella woodyi TaxID=60961 RepID=UPI0007F8D360|nr:hypothetical protein [Shewanella woodyi]
MLQIEEIDNGVDAAADVDGMDAIVEPSGRSLWRFAEVSTHALTAGNRSQKRYGLQRLTQ